MTIERILVPVDERVPDQHGREARHAAGRATRTGDPASALLHELKHGGYGLVVVGTAAPACRTSCSAGVVEKLVRLSPVPVVTVPDEAAQNLRH